MGQSVRVNTSTVGPGPGGRASKRRPARSTTPVKEALSARASPARAASTTTADHDEGNRMPARTVNQETTGLYENVHHHDRGVVGQAVFREMTRQLQHARSGVRRRLGARVAQAGEEALVAQLRVG